MKVWQISVVIISSVVVTTLGIGAADTWQGTSGSLLGQLFGATNNPCPAGMTYSATSLTFSCVDTYEASASTGCLFSEPETTPETTKNLGAVSCMAQSIAGIKPWRFIAREQATLACARAGKRLPTAAEWYSVALGTPPEQCNSSEGFVHASGEHTACTSAAGIYDAVGNVWEWVSDDVIDRQYNRRTLPSSGIITQVDSGGVATETGSDSRSEQFGQDYLWSGSTGVYGMMRGGFYGSKTDAGVFTLQAEIAPTFAGIAVGFRCVK